MDEIKIRKQAIAMYLQGHRPTSICSELNKSRPWFYKWLRRYQANPRGNWFDEESRRPQSIHQKISSELEQLVVNTRRQLENTAYAQIGAVSIQWEIKKLGLEPPSVWTIDRIIKRNRLTHKKEKASKKTNEYPGVGYPNVHQMDLVGPRYIKSYGRVYSLNIMDIETHCAHVNPLKNKATDGVVNAVIRFWKQFGIPEYLQMDNELSFRGSNRHPHSFGKLIRVALSLGVVPIFIPLGEPWRNGIIERFNDTFDKKFYRRDVFKDLDDMCAKALGFEEFHNLYHRYSAHTNHTPMEMFNQETTHDLLSGDYQIPDNPPLEKGDIILFRFLRSDRKLSVFGETFRVDKDLIYSYVKAVISVEGQALKVYRDDQLVHEAIYSMPVDWL